MNSRAKVDHLIRIVSEIIHSTLVVTLTKKIVFFGESGRPNRHRGRGIAGMVS